MKLTLKGYDKSAAEIEMPKPYSLNCSEVYSGVETKVRLGLLSAPPKNVCTVTLYIDDTEFFSGFVDTVGRTIDKKGDFGFISASVKYAKMTQNQVHPNSFTNMTSELLFQTYAQPYGATNDLPHTTLSKFDISAGMSAWDTIDLFCRQAYDFVPMIQRNGLLTVGGFKRSDITFGEGGVPYSSLKYIDNRSGMFSRVYMHASDDEYDYSIYMDYDGAKDYGIKRERYYKPPKPWQNLTKRGAGEVIRNALLNRYAYEITTHQFLSLNPGELVKVEGLGIDETTFYTASINLSYDENGITTKVVLYDWLSA